MARAHRVLTVFSIPKPFSGDTAVRQRNAIASWTHLHPDAQVVLFAEGEREASELGVEWSDVERNDHGTPLLSDAFARVERLRRHDVLAFVNADIVLFTDLPTVVERVRSRGRPFLVVGESWNARVDGAISFDAGWDVRLRRAGHRRGADALDWFVFSPGLYADMPPFAIGRTAFDNWLIWRARAAGALVVDATRVVHALHQDHDYDHFTGGLPAIRISEEAVRNRELAGGKSRLYSRFDATHVAARRGTLLPNLGAPLRWRERSRRALYKLRTLLGRR